MDPENKTLRQKVLDVKRRILEEREGKTKSEAQKRVDKARKVRLDSAEAQTKTDSPPAGPKAEKKSASEKKEIKRDYEIMSRAAGKLSKAPFAIMAKWTGHTHWNLSDQESEDLAHCVERVGQRYLPLLFEEHVELAALIICLIGLAGPRFFFEWTLLRAAKRAKTRLPKPEPEAEQTQEGE